MKKYGYYSLINIDDETRDLIQSLSDVVFRDLYIGDYSRESLLELLDEIKPGDHVYIGCIDDFSTNEPLHKAYIRIINLLGGTVYDVSDPEELEKLKTELEHRKED